MKNTFSFRILFLLFSLVLLLAACTSPSVLETCIPDSTYLYPEQGESIQTIVVGTTTYRGVEYCEAHAYAYEETPQKNITLTTIYYFDSDGRNVWEFTQTS